MPYSHTISGIYAITNTMNGHRYVGSAVHLSHRWNQHRHELFHGRHTNAHLQHAWNKYGQDAFHFSVLEECAAPQLIEREQWWIDAAIPEYNISKTAGNSLGCRRTAESRAKISAALTGRPCGAETRARRSAAMSGRPFSADHRAKLSAAAMGNKNGLGSKRTPEAKVKMSAAQTGNKKTRGHTLSEEHKAKIGAGNRLAWEKKRQ